MTEEPGRVSTWTLRVVVYGGLLAGVAMVVAAARSDDPPRWWWWVGIPLTLVCGLLVSVWIRFRLRYPGRSPTGGRGLGPVAAPDLTRRWPQAPPGFT